MKASAAVLLALGCFLGSVGAIPAADLSARGGRRSARALEGAAPGPALGMARPHHALQPRGGGAGKLRCDLTLIGTAKYGGWNACFHRFFRPKGARHLAEPAPVVFSFGVGRNVDFELGLRELFGEHIVLHSFDPTPDSLRWWEETFASREQPSELHRYGLGEIDGSMTMHLPEDPNMVSGTVVDGVAHKKGTAQIPLKRLSTILAELQISHLAVLKVDIEGSEFPVFDQIFAEYPAGQEPFDQLLIETHERFFHERRNGPRMTKLMRELQQRGFVLHHKTKTDEYTFLRDEMSRSA